MFNPFRKEEVDWDSIKKEYSEMMDIVESEIDKILNLKVYDLDAVNIFQSNTGFEIRFFSNTNNPRSFKDCEVYEFEKWYVLQSRLKFEVKAWKRGIRKWHQITDIVS